MARRAAMSTDAFHEDVVLGKAFDRRLMGRLLGYARPYRGQMLLALVLILLVTALSIVGPYLGKMAIDGPLAATIQSQRLDPDAPARSTNAMDSDALGELCRIGGIFALSSIFLMACRFFQLISMARIGQGVMFDLRMQLFSHLQRMPLAFYDRHPVGRLVTRITNDIEALNELFASGVVTFVADVVVLVGISAALIWNNLRLALVTLGVLPLLLVMTFVFRAKARRYYREQRGHLAHLNAFTQESIQGMTVIQVFDQTERNHERYRTINGRYRSAFLKTVQAYALYFPGVEIVGNLALVAIILVGSRLIGENDLTYGDFYFFWLLLGRFFQPIRDMAERYNVLQAAMASAERVFTILDARPGMERLPAPAPEISRLRGKVEFRHVWFSYRDDERVLRDVDFTVEPGEIVAIVGATGSGKSTIISLMSRLYDPQEGAILIDGVDIRRYETRDLRRRIGVVLQDVFLFSRSIADNIRLGKAAISDDDVRDAIARVNAGRFVERLEDGQEHVLSERGGSLSVGEKQLLAFARVLAHDPDILVLDEATAHVDTETEVLIQDALARILEGRTSVIIAHRLSTIRRAHRIIVLHKGKIREMGQHADLLKKGGIYARLHELQYE